MQNQIDGSSKKWKDYLRYLLLAICVLIISFIIPKKGRFKYEFEEGKVWMHEDLMSPFDYAIRKTDREIKDQKAEIIKNFKPFYNRDKGIADAQKEKFRNDLKKNMAGKEYAEDYRKYLLTKGLSLLDEYFTKGIVKPDSAHKTKPKDFVINEVENNVVEDRLLADYFTQPMVKASILEWAKGDTFINKPVFIEALLGAIDANLVYDKELSEKKLNELLESVSMTRGMKKQGEMIITRGSIVNAERYQMLNSLKLEYETKGGETYLIFIGYLVLVAALFIMYAFNLETFHEEIFSRTRSTVLVLIHILAFVGITAYLVNYQVTNVYIIPYTVLPIVLLAFFGVRIAILTHLLVTLLCGLIVPNPYEFVLLQALAGFTAILSMVRIRYISQFFVSALLISLTYCLVYLGFNFIKSTSIHEVSWETFIWFGGNFILTLIAYPLIYVNEKVFGFLSDLSLLELADINNKLMKELFLRAPGTFQHSLQVANLAEAVIDRIGGNALLARVGAMYHDIGKLYNPDIFIENQRYAASPHEQLNDIQSAEMIIMHVTRGVEIAHEHHLPKRVIDFIRTHHGTTRVEYFYKHYLQEHQDEEVDENVFRYPGPKPFSKETAVVMMVDSIEAASRSMKDPNEQQIDQLVDKIIDTKIQDKQFDYATITIQEINTARRIIKKLIKSIYHIRIQYPVEKAGAKSIE